MNAILITDQGPATSVTPGSIKIISRTSEASRIASASRESSSASFFRPGAERRVLPGRFNPASLSMPAQYPGHPLLSAALVWTKVLLPDARPTRTFVQRRLGSQGEMGGGMQSVIRQSCQVLDCEPFAVRAGRSESRLYAEMGRVDGTLTLLCDPTVAECSPLEQRFLVFRAIYAHVQRHNTLQALAQAWDGERLRSFLSLFYGWNQRNSRPIKMEDWAGYEPGLSCARSLSTWLARLATQYPTQAVADLQEMCCARRPFETILNEQAARFASQACEKGVAERVLARI